VVAALELYLDRDASRRIRTLWAALDAEGVQSVATLMQGLHRPHVSLVVAERLEPELVAEALDGFTVVPPLTLTFQFVGQFLGRVLWLGPAASVALLEHQAEVHARLRAAGVDVWEHYRPGRWVPHCTLSMRVPNSLMGISVRRCLEVVPIDATLVSAAIVDHARGIRQVLG
jgi:2'-5' RNA ligase